MSMNKYTISTGIILLGIIGVWLAFDAYTVEAPVNDVVQDIVPADVRAHIESKADLIQIVTPVVGSVVASPITVTGQARGYWFFEGSFPIVITDWNGLIIGEGYATAQGEWMTEEFVPFVADVSFVFPAQTPYKNGTLIFKKDNPSGLPEHDDALEIPVVFE